MVDINSTSGAFRNCGTFTKGTKKIHRTTINDADNLDLVIPIYSLIESNSNYSDLTGSLWFYSKDGAINFDADIANTTCYNIVQIILTQDKVYGFILKTKPLILMLIFGTLMLINL